MRSLFSFKALSMMSCASGGTVVGLFAGFVLYAQFPEDEVLPQQQTVAEIRKTALERSKRWPKKDQHRMGQTESESTNPAENAIKTGLLETARMPDMSAIITAKPVLTLDYTPTGSITMIKPKRLTGYRPGLERFHARLAAIDTKRSRRPVTVLHIGGSHVAADGFSRGIREDLQARYGDAGRGMVQPAGITNAGAADQMIMTIAGDWTKRHAIKDRRGRFGITGMSVSSSSTDASMRLTKNNGPFDWASVTIATGPDQGRVRLRVGTREKIYSAKARRRGSHTFRLDTSGTSLIVEPAGEGETTVLNWATGKVRPGIRYVNFGLDGASADILHRFNMKLMEKDVLRLNPELIIIGYGTQEGFDDKLGISGYRERLDRIVGRLKRWAPKASLVFIGAASGLRHGKDGACNGWSLPPKLAPLRRTIKLLASDHGAAYWDWSAAMGGPCAIDAWARNDLAEADRKHLTKTGYRRSARLFSSWLMQTENEAVASNN
ncbi:MAG: GDSL-type esterase/lipase family protein [Rhizobiaceae bacterium]